MWISLRKLPVCSQQSVTLSPTFARGDLPTRTSSRRNSLRAQATIAGLCLLPILLVVDRPWTLDLPSTKTWFALLGLGLLSSTLGHLIFFRLLTTAGATNISLVSYFMPVSAILLGVFFLGEVLESASCDRHHDDRHWSCHHGWQTIEAVARLTRGT